jgi:hypothetical protein
MSIRWLGNHEEGHHDSLAIFEPVSGDPSQPSEVTCFTNDVEREVIAGAQRDAIEVSVVVVLSGQLCAGAL